MSRTDFLLPEGVRSWKLRLCVVGNDFFPKTLVECYNYRLLDEYNRDTHIEPIGITMTARTHHFLPVGTDSLERLEIK